VKPQEHYRYLLLAITLLLLAAPVIEVINQYFPFFPLLFIVVVILALKAAYSRTWVFFIGSGLAILAFLPEFFPGYGFFEKNGSVLRLLPLFLYIFAIGLSIVMLGRRILSEKTVTRDTVQGGLSVYLLIGIFWMLLYLLVVTLHPDALETTIVHKEWGHVLLYYSFTTLTTLGYGDILPHDKIAMTLSALEAVVGQLFLAVFISRLVGLHIAHEISKKNITA